MRRGIEFSDAADRLIYESSLSSETKGDMLTTMALLAGLFVRSIAARVVGAKEGSDDRVRNVRSYQA
jgi:hypothetical protein